MNDSFVLNEHFPQQNLMWLPVHFASIVHSLKRGFFVISKDVFTVDCIMLLTAYVMLKLWHTIHLPMLNLFA